MMRLQSNGQQRYPARNWRSLSAPMECEPVTEFSFAWTNTDDSETLKSPENCAFWPLHELWGG